MKAQDRVGSKSGELLVLSQRRENNRAIFSFRCSCGTEFEGRGWNETRRCCPTCVKQRVGNAFAGQLRSAGRQMHEIYRRTGIAKEMWKARNINPVPALDHPLKPPPRKEDE